MFAFHAPSPERRSPVVHTSAGGGRFAGMTLDVMFRYAKLEAKNAPVLYGAGNTWASHLSVVDT